MKSIAWATDIHLDHLRGDKGELAWARFVRSVSDFDRLVITGDISTAYPYLSKSYLIHHLTTLSQKTGTELMVVLGNHDFWGDWMKETRDSVANIPGVTYLPRQDPIFLTDDTALIGVDGWYDGRLGRGSDSQVWMTDWDEILDYRFGGVSREVVTAGIVSKQAHLLESKLQSSRLDSIRRLVIATHVPPWPQNARYKGQVSDPDWLPWFTSSTIGDCIERFSHLVRPDLEILVLCGHSHSKADEMITSRIRCITGVAIYGRANLQKFDLESWLTD